MLKKTNESKSWFLEELNKNDRTFKRLIKKKSERSQITKIINEIVEIAIDT